MKKLLIILIVCCSLNGFGQEKDSTYFKRYSKLEYVDSVFYQKQIYYSNGKLWHEGWVIYATLNEGQRLGNLIGVKERKIPVEQNIGVHYYYNKDGSKMKEIIIPKDLVSGTIEILYDKKGKLRRKVYYEEKENIVFDMKDTKDKKTRDKSNMKLMRFEFYWKGKLSYTEEYDSNMKKNGCWKVYDKDGKIKSEKFFKNGELIRKICEQ